MPQKALVPERIITVAEFVQFLFWMPSYHPLDFSNHQVTDSPIQGPLVHFGLHNGIEFETAFSRNFVIGHIYETRFQLKAQLELDVQKIIPRPFDRPDGNWLHGMGPTTYGQLVKFIAPQFLPQNV